jgi:hypothetical protein
MIKTDIVIHTRGTCSVNNITRLLPKKHDTMDMMKACKTRHTRFLLQYQVYHGVREHKRLIKWAVQYECWNYITCRILQRQVPSSVALSVKEEEWLLYYLGRYNHLDIIKWCLKNDLTDLQTILCGAYKGSHVTLIEYLYKCTKMYKHKYDKSNLLSYACKGGNLELVKELIESGVEATFDAFNMACEYGHWHLLKYLQDKTPNTYDNNDTNRSVLFHVCKGKHNMHHEILDKCFEFEFCKWDRVVNWHGAVGGAAYRGDIALIEHIRDE